MRGYLRLEGLYSSRVSCFLDLLPDLSNTHQSSMWGGCPCIPIPMRSLTGGINTVPCLPSLTSNSSTRIWLPGGVVANQSGDLSKHGDTLVMMLRIRDWSQLNVTGPHGLFAVVMTLRQTSRE